jgi:arsenate reductase-like glutaredoxin family protein
MAGFIWGEFDNNLKEIDGGKMNIQIFGTNKCFDTKKAMRYFKERNIKYQFVDMKEKGLSKGEYNSVKQAVGGLDKMLNANCKDKDLLALIKYIADEDKDEKVLENQKVLLTPIVRNGRQATVGYKPEVWKEWK